MFMLQKIIILILLFSNHHAFSDQAFNTVQCDSRCIEGIKEKIISLSVNHPVGSSCYNRVKSRIKGDDLDWVRSYVIEAEYEEISDCVLRETYFEHVYFFVEYALGSANVARKLIKDNILNAEALVFYPALITTFVGVADLGLAFLFWSETNGNQAHDLPMIQDSKKLFWKGAKPVVFWILSYNIMRAVGRTINLSLSDAGELLTGIQSIRVPSNTNKEEFLNKDELSQSYLYCHYNGTLDFFSTYAWAISDFNDETSYSQISGRWGKDDHARYYFLTTKSFESILTECAQALVKKNPKLATELEPRKISFGVSFSRVHSIYPVLMYSFSR